MVKKSRWTNIELLTLGDLYREGLSYNEIACKLHRSEPAIATAIMKYRDVINVEYRAKGRGRTKAVPEPVITAGTPMVDLTPPETKPWWKFWA